MLQQNTNHILMVRPANFGYNEQTAANNAFQVNDTSRSENDIRLRAIEEFDEFVSKLRNAGVKVTVAQDSNAPIKPDAVFPNNWISFHPDGIVILYPMFAPLRRNERQDSVIDLIKLTFKVREIYDFTRYEFEDRFLEGTGSMIFDRKNKLVYACLSQRTDAGLLDRFCSVAGYEKIVFTATDVHGMEIYHTNVMMAMGAEFVVICMDTIKDNVEYQMLLETFAETDKTVINLSMEQVNSFAGNMLQVENEAGEPFLVMSSQAYESLNPEQIETIESFTKILHSDIKTIETYGGGSARCMMAEMFLEPKDSFQ